MSDRVQLEIAQSRELYTTWQVTKEKVLTQTRLNWLNKMYGKQGTENIKAYMSLMHKGEMD